MIEEEKQSNQTKMFADLNKREIFEQAKTYAFAYADQIPEMEVFPSEESQKLLQGFDEALPKTQTSAQLVLEQLNQLGGPNTIAQTGGRYFGFVNGGALPVAVATKWLSDFWDQNGGLSLTSPINAKLEMVCEKWLRELFSLPDETVAGFVSGTSTANICGLAAARYRLLKNAGWDINVKGLNGAPKIRVIAHQEVHSSVKKGLAILGFGSENIEWIPSDDKGCLDLNHLPELDALSLVLLQAGNVNTGAFDPFSEVCDQANAVGAWVHVDGAFGLWAAACESLSYLTTGMEKATSWAVDGHKTLNTPYDCGIVLCRDEPAMISALQATADYLAFSDRREPLLYTTEMSKRSRAIELWSCLKYLGKSGVDEMITGFHLLANRLAEGLKVHDFRIINDVVFNQVLVACETEERTKDTLANIQKSGECWCGPSTWKGESVIRVSVCSWATTKEDIERTIRAFVHARN